MPAIVKDNSLLLVTQKPLDFDRSTEATKGGLFHLFAKKPAKDEERTVQLVGRVKELVDADDTEQLNVEEINKLFFETVPQLSKKRSKQVISCIAESKALQNFLSEDLRRLREEKLRDEVKKNDPNHRLERKVAKMELANRLGIDFKKNSKGCSGSQVVKWVNGKTIGLFKPSHYALSYFKRMIKFFKFLIGDQFYYLSSDRKANSSAEVAAYKAKNLMNFNRLNVSPAKEVAVNGSEGAFIVWVHDRKDFIDIEKDFEAKKKYTKNENDLFQEFAIYDYFLGNLDRHEENWLVKYEKGEIVDIVPIDNENSFTEKSTDWHTILCDRSHFKWRKLKIAKNAFSKDMKRFLRENFTEEKVNAFIEAINEDLRNSENGGFLSEKMIFLLKQRAAVLRKIGESNEAHSPESLGKLRWKYTRARFLQND